MWCQTFQQISSNKLIKMFVIDVNRKLKFLAYAFGIIISHILYGVLQEEIFKSHYGTEPQKNGKVGEKFTFPVAFVAMQTVVFTLFAKSK